MSASNGNRVVKTTEERRAYVGSIVKAARVRRGLTQVQLAELVNQSYFTMISQVECGKVRIPADDTALWAESLGLNVQAFAQECVRAYESINYYHAHTDFTQYRPMFTHKFSLALNRFRFNRKLDLSQVNSWSVSVGQ